MEAIVHGGRRVGREERIFLKSHRAWYYTMDYDNHFIYEHKGYGSSVMCTCGSHAIVVNYDVYRRYHSVNKGAMLVCAYYTDHNHHADGSH